MARLFAIALFLTFAVYAMQVHAAPSPQEATTPSALEEAFKNAGESINKAFQDAKPQIDKFLSQGQELFDTLGKKIGEEASKIIPKTDQKPAA